MQISHVRFLIDQNVQHSVGRCLAEFGHDILWSRDAVGQGAPDPQVAAAAMSENRVLVSHDKDMKRIERYLSEGYAKRFPSLCRLMLNCPEPMAARRVEGLMSLIEFEFAVCFERNHRFVFHVQERRVRIIR